MIAMASTSRNDREQQQERRGGPLLDNDFAALFAPPRRKDHSSRSERKLLNKLFGEPSNCESLPDPQLPSGSNLHGTSPDPPRDRNHKEKKHKKHSSSSHDEGNKSKSHKSPHRPHSKDRSSHDKSSHDRSRRSPSVSSISSDKSESHRKEERRKSSKHSSSDASKHSKHHPTKDKAPGMNSHKGASTSSSFSNPDVLSKLLNSSTSTAPTPSANETTHKTFSKPKVPPPPAASNSQHNGATGARPKPPNLHIPIKPKDSHDIKGILAEMVKPIDSPISKIQTPRKADMPFKLGSMKDSDNGIFLPGDNMKNSLGATDSKSETLVNGKDIHKESDDSDSSSSSGSSSSDSSSSSSDSDSESEKEDVVPPATSTTAATTTTTGILSLGNNNTPASRPTDNQSENGGFHWGLQNFVKTSSPPSVKPVPATLPVPKIKNSRPGRPKKDKFAEPPDTDPEYTPKEGGSLLITPRQPRIRRPKPKQSIPEKVERESEVSKVKSIRSSSSSSSAVSSPTNSEDMLIDVVSPSSPPKPPPPNKPAERTTAISPFRPAAEVPFQAVPSRVTNSAHLPISPPDEKPHIPQAFPDVRSLPISIPLNKLIRIPGRKSIKIEPTVNGAIDGIPAKRKKSSKDTDRKSNKRTHLDSASEKDIVIKQEIKQEGGILNSVAVAKLGSLSSRPGELSLRTVPSYSETATHYFNQGRKLKKEGLASHNRPLRQILLLEALTHFLLNGMAREQNEPTKVYDIRKYYESIDAFTEYLNNQECKEEQIAPERLVIYRIWLVLNLYTQSHLSFKLWKMTKESVTKSRKVVNDHIHIQRERSGVSPHQPALPVSGTKGNRNSPCSPAPSPASITSVGSVASDTGTIAVPNNVYKCVEQYLQLTKRLMVAHEQWAQAATIQQLENQEFFDKLAYDVGYPLTMHTESKQFIHFVHTAISRIKPLAQSGGS